LTSARLDVVLYAKRHNGVDYIVVVLFQCLDSLLPRNRRLLHDQLNILALESRLVHLLAIVLIFIILLFLASLNGLALAVSPRAVVMACMLVDFTGLNDLVGGIGLSLRVEVFDFGLSKDAVDLLVID
jgi:hypothetical protein